MIQRLAETRFANATVSQLVEDVVFKEPKRRVEADLWKNYQNRLAHLKNACNATATHLADAAVADTATTLVLEFEANDFDKIEAISHDLGIALNCLCTRPIGVDFKIGAINRESPLEIAVELVSEHSAKIVATVIAAYIAYKDQSRKDKAAKARRDQERELHAEALKQAEAKTDEAIVELHSKLIELANKEEESEKMRRDLIYKRRDALLAHEYPTTHDTLSLEKGARMLDDLMRDHDAIHRPPALIEDEDGSLLKDPVMLLDGPLSKEPANIVKDAPTVPTPSRKQLPPSKE